MLVGSAQILVSSLVTEYLVFLCKQLYSHEIYLVSTYLTLE